MSQMTWTTAQQAAIDARRQNLLLSAAAGSGKTAVLTERIKKLITDMELADFLKINKRSLVEYRKNGILPYYHIGGRILYKESDVERIMQENFYDVFGKK